NIPPLPIGIVRGWEVAENRVPVFNARPYDHGVPVEHDRVPEMAGEMRLPSGTTVRDQQDVLAFLKEFLSLSPPTDIFVTFRGRLLDGRIDPDVPFVTDISGNTRFQGVASGNRDLVQRDMDNS